MKGSWRGIPCGASVTYDNGARVSTSFFTNLGSCKIRNAPELYRAILSVDNATMGKIKPKLPRFNWPGDVLRTTSLDAATKLGIAFSVSADECRRISSIESLKTKGKTIFGGGYLLSREATAEKVAAEKAAAEKIEELTLSESEKLLVKSLSQGGDFV